MTRYHRVTGAFNVFNILFFFTNYNAVTCPCGRVYYRNKESMMDLDLVLHENVHLIQIKRDGAIRFTFKYLYYLYKYGYEENPYEIEARKRYA